MKRLAVSTGPASIWQKLASVIAVLAVALFAMHAAGTQGAAAFPHGPHLSQAAAAPVTADAAQEPRHGHDRLGLAGHGHDPAGKGSPPCCGEACVAALLPGEEPPLDGPWGPPSRGRMAAASLTGHDPEGLRRPPRLSGRA